LRLLASWELSEAASMSLKVVIVSLSSGRRARSVPK